MAALVASYYARAHTAQSNTEKSSELPDISPMVHFEAFEPTGDKLESPRRIAASIVAQDNAPPKSVVDIGSGSGEFLEAFMDRFPASHGQWTEPVDTNLAKAKQHLRRFGDHVAYVIGCPSRDISQGCVPKGVDTLVTSWLSVHQDLAGIRKYYVEAVQRLPAGGWVINLDHVSSPWEARIEAARIESAHEGLSSMLEGPPVHHPEFVTPTLEDQLAALRSAGVNDVQVVWRRYNTVLIMGRKN
jgi:hypothetical protein